MVGKPNCAPEKKQVSCGFLKSVVPKKNEQFQHLEQYHLNYFRHQTLVGAKLPEVIVLKTARLIDARYVGSEEAGIISLKVSVL